MTVKKRGMALPIVLLFTLIVMTFLTALSMNQTRVKKQSLASHTQKKAYYMAMGGIQHTLLKFRILQRQGYDAACLARGICPFFNAYGGNLIVGEGNVQLTTTCLHGMKIFMSDLNSDTVKFKVPGDYFISDPEKGWKYTIQNFNINSYYTAPDGTVKIVMNVEAMGYAFDIRDNKDKAHKEYVTKKVILTRKIR